jgi:hypothetical protein
LDRLLAPPRRGPRRGKQLETAIHIAGRLLELKSWSEIAKELDRGPRDVQRLLKRYLPEAYNYWAEWLLKRMRESD